MELQVKSDDWLHKRLDVTMINLDNLKTKIKKKINDVLKIEDFVFKQLKAEQFACPKTMAISLFGFLNGPIITELVGELWTILLAAEEGATCLPADTTDVKKKKILKKVFCHQKENKKSRSHSRSKNQDNMESSRKEQQLPTCVLSVEQQLPKHSSAKNPTNENLNLNNENRSKNHSIEKNINQSGQASNDATEMDTFDIICPLSSQERQQPEANHVHTPPTEFLSESCLKINQSQDKTTLQIAEKFKYPHANNTANCDKKQVSATLFSAKEVATTIPSDSMQQTKDERKKETQFHSIPFTKLSMPTERINLRKIQIDVLRPWIAKKVTELLYKEDNKAVEYIFKKIKEETILCPKKLQINIAGFLRGTDGLKFLHDLWAFLLSTFGNEIRIPAKVVQQKKDENVNHCDIYDASQSHSRFSNDGDKTKGQKKKSLKIGNSNKENDRNLSNVPNQLFKRDRSKDKAPERQHESVSHSQSRKESDRRDSNVGSSQKAEKFPYNPTMKVCPIDTTDANCKDSLQKSSQKANGSYQDQSSATRHKELIEGYYLEMDEFLDHWNQPPDKETFEMSKKFIYSDANNVTTSIEKLSNITALSAQENEQAIPANLLPQVKEDNVRTEVSISRSSSRKSNDRESAEKKLPPIVLVKNASNCYEILKPNKENNTNLKNKANQSSRSRDNQTNKSKSPSQSSGEPQKISRNDNDDVEMMISSLEKYLKVQDPFKEFIHEHCVQMDEFLKHHIETFGNETTDIANNLKYCDATNIATSGEKQESSNLLSIEETTSSTSILTDSLQQKTIEMQAKDQKSQERFKSNSNSQTSKQFNMGSIGNEKLIPPVSSGQVSKPLTRVDLSKVKLDALRPWISKTITAILCKEDEKSIEFVFNKMKQEKFLYRNKFQIHIAGFLSGIKGQKFLNDLWPLLLSAQQNDDGIPPELNTTTLLPPAAVEILENKQPNQIKSETKLITISELPSRKRIRSTKSNENKKSKNNSSGKDEQQPAKKKRKVSEKSSSKCSSEKVSSRNSEADSNENKSQPNCSSQLMLDLHLTDDDDN